MVNQQFQFAVHIMAALAFRGRRLDSRALATSVYTNPVVIRRLLLALRRAELIETRAGRRGGACLAKPADQISLLDIYEAIELPSAICVHQRRVCRHCPVSRSIKHVLGNVSFRADKAVRRELRRTSIAKIVRDIAYHGR